MRKALILITLLSVVKPVFSQHYRESEPQEKLITVQVVPTVIDHDGLKYGFGIGVNVEQHLSINYFHVRDYDYGDDYSDKRYSGIYINTVIPFFKKIEIGPSVRLASMNGEWQNPSWAAELRYKFSKYFRLGIEKGIESSRNSFAAKLIFNLY